MSETWNKREREKKKQMLKKQKVEKKLERKDKPKNGNDLDSMMAYIDENGNLLQLHLIPATAGRSKQKILK